MEKRRKGETLSYRKKKETIKKKTRELSILCDIKACAILLGPNGEVDTWPENPSDFNPIIQSYKRKEKIEDAIDDGFLKKKSKKNNALFSDDQWLNDMMSRESKQSLLVKLNSKLEAVEKRIEFLKMVNCGNGGSTSSRKEIVLADQGSSNVEISVDQLTTSRGEQVAGANQETYDFDFDEFWGSGTVGDQLENTTAYNQETEIAMAAEFNGDQLRDCSQGQEVGFLGIMPNEMNNVWETLNNLDNLQNFGFDDDLWPSITGSEFDLLPQEATGFGTLLDQLDSFMPLQPNYDYSIPFFH
ncbi:uncharacterized protein LOC129874114 [Solanum dulcamara]|uniref:uncharacterized protein LOC129874114 n=1 Tax=Solanum dulcamara TaxID=45834 RepID=UPI0024853DB6|nr:uncharacterized protein LOC129874114 [Solanum dulcamara]